MWFGIGIIGAIIWILLALWPARIAASKGRSFFGWFLLSLLFWWITLFVALAMKPEGSSSATPPPAPSA